MTDMVFIKGRFGRLGGQDSSDAEDSVDGQFEDDFIEQVSVDDEVPDRDEAQSLESEPQSPSSSSRNRRRSRSNQRRSSQKKHHHQDSSQRGHRAPDLPGDPLILLRDEHCISRKNIDQDALKVMRRIVAHGYWAFLVGGAVRDLLLEKEPKDYDVSTSAPPEEVRSLFRNSRIIGRRFRINHVYFRGNKIIEVSTFRDSAEAESAKQNKMITSDNVYGDPETDAVRRDLTINGLFYDLSTFSVIDYVGGIEDLDNEIVRIIGEPEIRIQEDPVRMIRAIRHAARRDFTIEEGTYQAICKSKALIKLCSSARVFEEFMRELRGAHSRASFRLLDQTGLLPYLMPVLSASIDEDNEGVWERLENVLSAIDLIAEGGVELSSSVLLLAVLIGNLPAHYYAVAGEDTEETTLLDYWRVSPVLCSVDSSSDSELKLPRREKDADRFRRRGARKGKVSKLAKMISLYFEGVGVSRRDREQMEHLLIARKIMLCGAGVQLEAELRQRAFFKDALTLLRLTAHDEASRQALTHWEKASEQKPSRRRRRRRPRRADGGNSR